MSRQPYVTAAGFRVLTPLYDTVVRLTMREPHWRPLLVEQVLDGLAQDGVIVDVGAGTGAFAIPLAQRDRRVIAVDGDEDVRAIARRRPGAQLVDWRDGLATALPVGDGEADRVVMSLLLHHLDAAATAQALAEARRVLRPGGRLHIADWGRPHDPLMRASFGVLQLIDGVAGTRDHVAGRLPGLVAQSGFGSVAVTRRLRTAFGSLEVLTAR